MPKLRHEVERRRTFAIISHPDAGKTTLTEKLLLYGGAIDIAGAVRTRKSQRHATSDWMSIEQSRGISITSTALQFEYMGYCFNLLDTPGHQDFSEDTYRTLLATDSAVMVLDSAKGIEPQTRKLFKVCRLRKIPILAFINKLDHPGKDPFELLSEIEKDLGVEAAAMNWPIGNGPDFQGVFDLQKKQVLRFERTTRSESRAPMQVSGIDDPSLAGLIGESATAELREANELLEGAGSHFDFERFRAGDLIPVYFGSAINNFGVGPFLEALYELAPPPGPRPSSAGPIDPVQEMFSGFVFKIQANMDKRHRDRLAFVRVCSGVFEKDMMVNHSRLDRQVRMTRPHRLFARERETIEEAYPGDVIGFVNPGLFNIGDTLSSAGRFEYERLPRFAPEHFAIIRSGVGKQKQFLKGIEQLEEEGVMQVLYSVHGMRSEPVLAVVGELQFDVLESRLLTEYGVETTTQRLPYKLARWVEGDIESASKLRIPGQSRLTVDSNENPVILFSDQWELEYAEKHNPGLKLKAND